MNKTEKYKVKIKGYSIKLFDTVFDNKAKLWKVKDNYFGVKYFNETNFEEIYSFKEYPELFLQSFYKFKKNLRLIKYNTFGFGNKTCVTDKEHKINVTGRDKKD